MLAPTKVEVLARYAAVADKGENVARAILTGATGRPFYNLLKLGFATLLDDLNQFALNLNGYLNGFSANARGIMERFAFPVQIARMGYRFSLRLADVGGARFWRVARYRINTGLIVRH